MCDGFFFACDVGSCSCACVFRGGGGVCVSHCVYVVCPVQLVSSSCVLSSTPFMFFCSCVFLVFEEEELGTNWKTK